MTPARSIAPSVLRLAAMSAAIATLGGAAILLGDAIDVGAMYAPDIGRTVTTAGIVVLAVLFAPFGAIAGVDATFAHRTTITGRSTDDALRAFVTAGTRTSEAFAPFAPLLAIGFAFGRTDPADVAWRVALGIAAVAFALALGVAVGARMRSRARARIFASVLALTPIVAVVSAAARGISADQPIKFRIVMFDDGLPTSFAPFVAITGFATALVLGYAERFAARGTRSAAYPSAIVTVVAAGCWQHLPGNFGLRSLDDFVEMSVPSSILLAISTHLLATTRGVPGATHSEEAATAIRTSRFVLLLLLGLAICGISMTACEPQVLRGFLGSGSIEILVAVGAIVNVAAAIRCARPIDARLALIVATFVVIALFVGGIGFLRQIDRIDFVWNAMSVGGQATLLACMAFVVVGGSRLLVRVRRVA